MLGSRPEVSAVVGRYVDALRRRGVEVDRVYLFGSYRRGTANEWSDIDVVVVSPSFGGKPPWERAEITGLARYDTFQATAESVAGLARTPEEVAGRHPASFLADVLEDAEVLFDRQQAPVTHGA